MITLRDLHTDQDYHDLERLQQEIWVMPDLEVVPDRMIQVFVHCGGHALGAFDGATMIGFTLALVAHEQGKVRLWSHMAGVLDSYRGQHIGFDLKVQQRIWALAHGFDTIAWTFDPLQRVNAGFNLHRLRAVGTHYHLNFYGEMQDALNRGMRSDRLEVSWRLNDPHVLAAVGGAPAVLTRHEDAPFLVTTAADDLLPVVNIPEKFTNPCYFVEVPYALAAVRQRGNAAVTVWRDAHAHALGKTLAAGYTVADFVTTDHRCWYVLVSDSSGDNA